MTYNGSIMQTEAVKIGSEVFRSEADVQVFLESMNTVSEVFAFINVVSFLEVGTVEPSSTNEFITRAYQLDKINMSILYNATITILKVFYERITSLRRDEIQGFSVSVTMPSVFVVYHCQASC
jgi:hypothetical protein